MTKIDRLLGGAALCALALAVPAYAQDAETTEDVIIVTGSQVELNQVFEGGQVARGARNGLLGNVDFLDSPFTTTAYTAELIENQQARGIGDVLANNPQVRLAKGFGNFQELYVVRGFPVYSDDMTLNGVYGILPRQYVAAELVERVEVFSGANAFLNGAAPGGSGVGGAFNLVPKRAGEDDLTRVTLGFEGRSHGYAALDLSRRFGAQDELGVRFNGALREGETAIEDQDRSLNLFTLGLSYETDRLRLSADLGWQDHHIDAPRPQVTPLGAIPAVPEADVNYAQPWTFTDEQQLFGVVRAEMDFSDVVTGWLAVGARDGEEANVLANPSAGASGVTSAYRFDNARADQVISADAGLRADVWTGEIGHRLVASVSGIHSESDNAYAFSSFAGFAGDLNDPFAAPQPAADFFVGGDLDNPGKTEEVTNTSFALADTMSLLEGRVLATVGLRWQAIDAASFDYNTGAELSRYEDDAITPAFGLVYRASDAVSLYANYAESLQPGQTAPASSGGTPIVNAGEVLAPFRGEQMEAGVKYDAGAFGVTANLFELTQPSAIVVGDRFTDGGEQRTRGAELTVFGEPVEGLRLIGGATWLDAEQVRTQGGLNEGNAVVGVPELQASFNAEWDARFLPGLVLEGRVIYTGEQYPSADNTLEIPAWARFDAGVRYSFEAQGRPTALRARVENLLDDDYWASTGGFPGANYLVQGEPRTVRVSVSTDF
ncbi:TonB-dependent siderophore receptor [Oceanicaulis sp. MMSF_3324]|uniref:TonB-dependent receptor n=1 Tax=Oceanicaulis sp. MMSF_3324 TaxID=3046702 RepID=UPI00273D79B5|nr:TonB-dependent siderophore receptor [Oceanicaulis sp. MMSF_3324]